MPDEGETTEVISNEPTIYLPTDFAEFAPVDKGREVLFDLHAESTVNGQATVLIDRLRNAGEQLSGSYRYGAGCHGLEQLAWGVPFLGNKNFALFTWGNLPFANTASFMIFGASPLNIGLGAIAPTCSLYASLDVILFAGVLDKGGFGALPLPVPNSASLVGLKFHTQAIGITTKNALGLALSNGVTSTIR